MFSKKIFYFSSTFIFLLIGDKECVEKSFENENGDSLGLGSVRKIILLADFFKLMRCKNILFFLSGQLLRTLSIHILFFVVRTITRPFRL